MEKRKAETEVRAKKTEEDKREIRRIMRHQARKTVREMYITTPRPAFHYVLYIGAWIM
jgi:hypothetical protein